MEINKNYIVNLKNLMKMNPNATVARFLVLINHKQCAIRTDFDETKLESYDYYVIGGFH